MQGRRDFLTLAAENLTGKTGRRRFFAFGLLFPLLLDIIEATF